MTREQWRQVARGVLWVSCTLALLALQGSRPYNETTILLAYIVGTALGLGEAQLGRPTRRRP